MGDHIGESLCVAVMCETFQDNVDTKQLWEAFKRQSYFFFRSLKTTIPIFVVARKEAVFVHFAFGLFLGIETNRCASIDV